MGRMRRSLAIALCSSCCGCMPSRLAAFAPPAAIPSLRNGGAPALSRSQSPQHQPLLSRRRRPRQAAEALLLRRPRMVATDPATAARPDAPAASNGGTATQQQPPAPLSLEAALELGVNRALRGDGSVLRQVLSTNAEWRGPLGNHRGVAAVEAELRGLGKFLQDPRLTILEPVPENITGTNPGGNPSNTAGAAGEGAATTLEWIASATWPLPWLPRFVVRGSSTVRTTAGTAAEAGKAGGAAAAVASIVDTWDAPWLGLAARQLIPGFWDIWHQLCSPPGEQYPYRVLAKRKGYEVRLMPPRLCVEAGVVDRTNERRKRMAALLPDFVFTADLRTSGRSPETYSTSFPVEVTVAPLVETTLATAGGAFLNGTARTREVQRRANRITWRLQAPTAFGLDPASLAACDASLTEAEAKEGSSAKVLRQGWRVVAVAPFNGRPQDKEAAAVRQNLLRRIEEDGVTAVTGEDGRPQGGILQHDGKAGWNRAGQIVIGIWEHRPPWIGNGNEVYVDIQQDAWRGRESG